MGWFQRPPPPHAKIHDCSSSLCEMVQCLQVAHEHPPITLSPLQAAFIRWHPVSAREVCCGVV